MPGWRGADTLQKPPSGINNFKVVSAARDVPAEGTLPARVVAFLPDAPTPLPSSPHCDNPIHTEGSHMLITRATLLTCLLTLSALSQEFRGTIQGTITDPSQAAVPNAAATLKNLETGI